MEELHKEFVEEIKAVGIKKIDKQKTIDNFKQEINKADNKIA